MDYAESGAASAAVIIYYLFILAIAVAVIAGQWKMFAKAGEPGWASLIPFYNQYVLFKIAWGNGLLFLLLFLPIIDFIVLIILPFKVAKSYGCGVGYGLGLLFLPFVFYPLLGFGSSQYIGPDGRSASPKYVINQYNYNMNGQQGDSDVPNVVINPSDNAQSVSVNGAANPVNASFWDNAPERTPEIGYNEPPQQQEADEEFKFCVFCGGKVRKSAKFCTHCGASLAEMEEPAHAEPQQPAYEAEPAFAEPQYEADQKEPEYDLLQDQTVIDAQDFDDFGEKTEILLDDPVVIMPAIKMIRMENEEEPEDDIMITNTPYVIGRSTTNADRGINAKGISRRHIQFDYENGVHYVTDLNSTNGVFLNDNRISPMEQTAIADGDVIGLGRRKYRIEIH